MALVSGFPPQRFSILDNNTGDDQSYNTGVTSFSDRLPHVSLQQEDVFSFDHANTPCELATKAWVNSLT